MKAAVTPWDFTENTPTKKAKDKRGTQSSRVHKLIKKIRMSSDFTSLPFSVLVLSNTFSSVIFTLCNISQSSRVWLFSRPRYNHTHNEWLMMAVSSFWQQEQNAYLLSFMCFHSRSKWDCMSLMHFFLEKIARAPDDNWWWHFFFVVIFKILVQFSCKHL